MDERKGLTVVGLIVIIFAVAFILAILMPMHGKVPHIAERVVCGTNLKGLGMAIAVYANDYDGMYPQLPGTGSWSKWLGFAYDYPTPDLRPSGQEANVTRTISASWYLLVREADVSPKAFICPSGPNKAFSPRLDRQELYHLWDFGSIPYRHVDYAMHNPYGNYPANRERSAAFVVAADMNPWFRQGDIVPAGRDGNAPQLLRMADWSYMADWRNADRQSLKAGNSLAHKIGSDKFSEGQNVLFADGHSSYETRADVGVRNDNIYTYWSTEEEPTDQDRQGGTAPTGRGAGNDAKSRDDSFLAI